MKIRIKSVDTIFTNRPLVPHILIGKSGTIGSDSGLSPGMLQAII